MMTGNSIKEKKGECILKVLSPLGILKFDYIPPAKRINDLRNKKIGLYWNNKARGDAALIRVKELLSERYEGMSFEWFETEPSVLPSRGEEDQKRWLENVKKSGVDGVVASTGD